MGLKGFFSCSGGRIIGHGFSSGKAFFYMDILGIFQMSQVRSQIAIRDFEEFLEGIKVILLIDHEDGHDAQSDDVFKCLVVVSLHFIDRIGNTSWSHRSHEGLQIPVPNKASRNPERMRLECPISTGQFPNF